MNLNKWLVWAGQKLKNADIDSAQLDALLLLEDELRLNRAYLLAHPEIEISPPQLKNLNAKLRRRLQYEPISYIRGFSEFYGRQFKVNKYVLEPRPESETMIELLLQQKLSPKTVIVDVGTGSGALAVTAKLELPKTEVIATEVDQNALEVAKLNAKKLGADIKFYQGDLLNPALSTIYRLPTIVLANLPYVPSGWQINQAAATEPKIAIFGGKDGLDLYRRLFSQIEELAGRPQLVFTESLPPQHRKLRKIGEQAGYSLVSSQDFIQVFSV